MRHLAALALLALALGCREERAPAAAVAPLCAGDGGFVRPRAVGGGAPAHVAVDPVGPDSLYLSGQERSWPARPRARPTSSSGRCGSRARPRAGTPWATR